MTTSQLIQGYEVVIGFETHAQLSTHSKIFSRASIAFGAQPNTQACPVDLALPGVLLAVSSGFDFMAIANGTPLQPADVAKLGSAMLYFVVLALFVLWASARVGLPVKWTSDRGEALQADLDERGVDRFCPKHRTFLLTFGLVHAVNSGGWRGYFESALSADMGTTFEALREVRAR